MNEVKDELTNCCVKNCQKQIKKSQAITIEGKIFCKICGTAFYRQVFSF
ncbi:MAG: hypothetical protein BAJALOKI1v1_20018 [Promethearchaeota archaeon]|nr:MAG: hypothetical protein BAJALOKI1v1_20018 [Candidatus Lokiarchaeota archaeon]